MQVRLVALCIVSLFLVYSAQAITSVQGTRNYEAHQVVNAQKTQHFYLNERSEGDQKIFSLFYRENQGLQDLLWEKRFPLEQSQKSEEWLRAVVQQYGLQLKTPNVFASNSSDFDSFSEEDESPISAGVQWKANKDWNEQWEVEYGKWVSKVLHPKLMLEMNLATDCADLAYVLRWAFARIHRLPMAVRLGGSSQLFTNETMKEEWLSLPQHEDWQKDKRFRAILQYLMRNTYTHTLMEDSYPVAINPQALMPGTHLLDLHGSSGHTMVVQSVNDPKDLPVTLLFSTVPIKVRELISTFYQDQETPKLNRNGFYKIRWAKKTGHGWKFVPVSDIPGYSLEQFSLESSDSQSSMPHFLKVFNRINPQFSVELLLERSTIELRDRVKDRIKMVEDGFAFCRNQNCAPGSRGDDDWSTPSRDARLLQLHDTINLALELLPNQLSAEQVAEAHKKISTFAKQESFLIDGESYSLFQIVVALVHGLTSTDPRLSVAQRWGVSFDGYSKNLIASLKANRNKYQKSGHDSPTGATKLATQWLGVTKLCSIEQESRCEGLTKHLEAEELNGRSLENWLTELQKDSAPRMAFE